ncbi:hypothetical protein [Methylosinus sp. Sm6]|uniref:hypothetical protein n=1 Tax=Methylosinus sp. Sm6 TaxID=2866948 RepID=UPI00351D45CC
MSAASDGLTVRSTHDGFDTTLAIGADAAVTLTQASGADTLDGGAGVDALDYSNKFESVVLTLKGSANTVAPVDGVAEDTIRNIENVYSGSGDDVLSGDDLANLLSGGGGNDVF